MRATIIHEARFDCLPEAWEEPVASDAEWEYSPDGISLKCAPEGRVTLRGPGVHTRNGDSIEVHFRLLQTDRGVLSFGFEGGFESATVHMDLGRKRVQLRTTDWTWPQPVADAPLRLSDQASHSLRIEKTEGSGGLVKSADLRVFVDEQMVLSEQGLNLLPEMGVKLEGEGVHLMAGGFWHRGTFSGVPEHLHVGGWQMLNVGSIQDNLASLFRGIRAAAEQGVQLLVTPETSLTGLYPTGEVTWDRDGIAEAESRLRAFLPTVREAPYVVVGLPIWERVPGHRREETRYNVSRVYDPEGGIVGTYPKVHSCETEFWHGYRLHEFDVYGVPVCMHICHDGRYPELWTLPVMLGARLILHPANGGQVRGSVDAFEAKAKGSTSTSHAFYVHVNGGGGSYIAGPKKFDNLIAVSDECQRDNRAFPMVGEPVECLLHANLHIWDAFGYWPVRSFRASEETAAAYGSLYQSMGGQRSTTT
jgi:predicted amidohydrolase